MLDAIRRVRSRSGMPRFGRRGSEIVRLSQSKKRTRRQSGKRKDLPRERPEVWSPTEARWRAFENVPLENGRCRLHGGLTPKGAQWHKPQLAMGTHAKLERKLNDLEKRRKKRERRVARMTPQERERHAAWQASHKPGSGTERERRRRDLGSSRADRGSDPAVRGRSAEAGPHCGGGGCCGCGVVCGLE